VTGHVKAIAFTRWIPQAELLLLAVAIGAVSGLACVALRMFFELLQAIFTGHLGPLPEAAAQLPLWRRAMTPVAGAAVALLVAWFHQRHATKVRSQEYIEAVRLNEGRIALAPTFWRTLSSAFSVASGAAIGREGSMIQFAAGVTSWLGQRMHRSLIHLPRLVAWGVAAAVAAVYQAPVAGFFFGAEIVLGRISLDESPCLLASAFTGAFVSRTLLGAGPLFRVAGPLRLDLSQVWLTLCLAILMGLLGPLYYWLIHSMGTARKLPLALLWSGALVGALSLCRTEVWGNGDVALLHIMQVPASIQAVFVILVLRLFATVLCVGTRTVGGVFTPTLFAGGAVGLLFGHLLHSPSPILFAVLGMSCLLAAVTHAPWMATFMAAELTGKISILPLLLICSLLAWRVARCLSPHSLYALATPEPGDDLGLETVHLSVESVDNFTSPVSHSEVA
jgi:CIC family chloride channel protein